MKTLFLLTLYTAALSLSDGNAQYNTFDVLIGERIMGKLKAYHPAVKGSGTHTKVIAEVDVPLFGRTIEVYNEFEDNKLVSAKARKVVDSEVKEEVITSWSDEGYAVVYNQSGKKRSSVFHNDIVFTTLMLYYKEPVNIHKVYSERFGQMASVVKVGNSRYELRLPDGKKTLYTYKNGACVHIQSEVMGAKIVFRAVGTQAQ
jgi:Iap family predicted aminopeptidase